MDSGAVGYLSEALAFNRTLEIIDLAGNRISNSALRLINNLFAQNKKLKTIDLSYTEINIFSFEELAEEVIDRIRFEESFMEK